MGKTQRIYYISFLYILTLAVLVGLKMRQYDWNFSALIGIWKGFADLNPGYIEKGTVLFRDSGYDGQFFYLNARFLFDAGLDIPRVDSFYFRFHRIGFSIVTGLLAKLAGFDYYAGITIFLLGISALVTYYLIEKEFSPGRGGLAYLFNPFVINSTMLLVADSFFVFLLAISFYLLSRSNTLTFQNNNKNMDLFYLSVVTSGLAVFTRETGIMFSGTFFLYFAYRKKFQLAFWYAVPVILFFGFVYFLRSVDISFKGINPVGFFSMIDWPLFGFFKSLDFSFTNPKSLIVYAVFIYFLLTGLSLRNIHNIESFILHLPLIGILFIAAIGEKSYWESFDNITRMFAPVLLWILFLKKKYAGYRDYFIVKYTLFFLLLLFLRLFLQKPLPWNIY